MSCMRVHETECARDIGSTWRLAIKCMYPTGNLHGFQFLLCILRPGQIRLTLYCLRISHRFAPPHSLRCWSTWWAPWASVRRYWPIGRRYARPVVSHRWSTCSPVPTRRYLSTSPRLWGPVLRRQTTWRMCLLVDLATVCPHINKTFG